MNSKLAAVAATGIAIGICLGAVGAHMLKPQFTPQEAEWFETGVRYFVWNAIGLLALSALPIRPRLGIGFVLAGMVIFSGSIFGLAFGLPRFLGAVAPIGGALLIIGWLIVAASALRHKSSEQSN